jgi:murein L,D-transpeptidase YcbB/YkuD
MNNHSFLILILLFIGCKTEPIKTEVALNLPIQTSIPVIQTIKKNVPVDSTLLYHFKSKSLVDFYKSVNYTTVWQTEETRKIVLQELYKSDEEGLNPADYNVNKLQSYERKIASLTDQEIANFDILITINFQKYISHLTNGRLSPQKLYKNWDLKENKIDINKTTLLLANSDSLVEKIELLKPNHIVYKRLKKALKIINTFPKDDLRKIKFKDKIALNDTNKSLIDIKKRLIYWKDMAPKDSLSPIYDAETANALKKFQVRHGLSADGIIGKGTVESLNFSKKERKEQILVNLERWKWFPKDMGNEYVIINIPDYKLTLVKNQDTLRIHKVIVGRPKRKTPVLSSKLTQVIFNPTWTVPPTILREDIIPEILKNRNYLAKINIKLHDQNGNVVSANNWSLSNAKNYRYVQSPGTFNSLGMVKLIFPNRFSVYLHDTNHREFFTKPDRSLSSGCVRVENPLELTEYLLDNPTHWNLEKITKTLQNEKTEYAAIKKNVLFHLLYWTSWSDKNTLVFRDDIYNLDSELYHKLGN